MPAELVIDGDHYQICPRDHLEGFQRGTEVSWSELDNKLWVRWDVIIFRWLHLVVMGASREEYVGPRRTFSRNRCNIQAEIEPCSRKLIHKQTPSSPCNPMAPTKKSKAAKSTESISARLALVVKSGKYSLGYKSALKQMRSGKGEYRVLQAILQGLERDAEKVPCADHV
jgi:hypothetical protein